RQRTSRQRTAGASTAMWNRSCKRGHTAARSCCTRSTTWWRPASGQAVREQRGCKMRPEPGTPPPGAEPQSTLCWLGHPHCHDVTHVGGKAASLSRLAARFQVPHGFCLPTTAYADWSAAACSSTPHMLPRLADYITAAYAKLARACGMPEP